MAKSTSGLEQKIGEDIQQIEEELKMPYITSIERMGIEKGLSQERTRMLQKLLARRFGAVPGWAEQRISTAQPEQLEHWSLRVLDGKSLEEVLAVNETPAGYGDAGGEQVGGN